MVSNDPANTDIEPKEIDPALDPALDQLSRRTLLSRAGAGAAGLVASTVLGSAAAQETGAPKHALEDESLDKQDMTYPSRGGGEQEAQIKAFLARPKTAGKRGSVIVIHEIFGLNDHIKDVACRLAQAGFTALAPDLFTREGTPPPMSGGFAPLMQFVGKIPDSQIMGDIQAAVHALRERPDSNHKAGIVGFCYGGRVSMLADAYVHDLNAAVAYYGRITGDKTANQPTFPLDVAGQMHAPLLGHFGAEDQSIPPADVDKLREVLKAHHKTADLYVYENAGHAFNNDTRESYRPEAARLAWQRTIAWFDKYVK